MTQHLEIEIKQFFSGEQLNQLAKETSFVQRESKISGQNFFDIIVFNNEQLKEQSLNDLAIDLAERYGINITKQSLQARFNDQALIFLKQALERLLKQQLNVAALSTSTAPFSRILIKDSISFQIDKSMADSYPGSGGKGSPAAVRIQFEYDLLNGHINDLSVNALTDQDATNSIETLELAQEGDFIIRDLAYINLTVLKGIIYKGAYVLSRLPYNVNVYEWRDNCYQELDFVALRNYMIQHQLGQLEKEVYLGAQEHLNIRLLIQLLPDELVAERLRKAQQRNRKRGGNPLSQAYKARAALNLFITNATPEQLPLAKAGSFYRLRWQIELIFKIWKSLCQVDKVKKVKQERLECYIYSKLIGIVIVWQMIWAVAIFMFRTDKKALSYYKAYKTMLRDKLKELRVMLFCGVGNMNRFISGFYQLSKTKHLLEKKQQKPTSIQILITCLN